MTKVTYQGTSSLCHSKIRTGKTIKPLHPIALIAAHCSPTSSPLPWPRWATSKTSMKHSKALRSVSVIAQKRHKQRYQDALVLAPQTRGIKSHVLPPFSSMSARPEDLSIPYEDVVESLHTAGITNSALASAISSGPLTMADIKTIYKSFGVRAKQSKQASRPPTPQFKGNRCQRKRALHAALRPKVLGDHLLSGKPSGCSTQDLHATYDPTFGEPSASIQTSLKTSSTLEVDEALNASLETKSLPSNSAPG